MGGTFMALAEDYRDYFIRNLHDALSGHTSNNVAEAVRYSSAVCEVLFVLLVGYNRHCEGVTFPTMFRIK